MFHVKLRRWGSPDGIASGCPQWFLGFFLTAQKNVPRRVKFPSPYSS